MDYKDLSNDTAFLQWHKYEPLDTQYIRYSKTNPSAIAAGHKINDVCCAFANARQSFRSVNCENYGDLAGEEELCKLYTKTHFLLNAVSEYALCLDLSWQVIWAYIQPASFEYLLNFRHKELENECNRENLCVQLDCAISQKNVKAEKLKAIMKDFDDDPDIMKLRQFNNSIKHHGTIHFENLGANFSSMMFSINGESVKTLSRKTYTIEEIEELLFTYHTKFQNYFNSLINEIMPLDYLETKVPFGEYFSVLQDMMEVQST